VEDCGSENISLVSYDGSDFLEFPKCCDNRGCCSSDCESHRGVKHKQNHIQQIQWIQKYVRSPKSWVFTGYRLNLSVDEWREKAQSELIRLFRLLSESSKTPFVIYLEFKVHADGSYYLHFHAVSGSVGDIHLIQARWGRIVRYEHPLTSEAVLIRYIKKYTGKTPLIYVSESSHGDVKSQPVTLSLDAWRPYQEKYIAVTYKLQMCRYSVLRKEAIAEFGLFRSHWYIESLLVSECKSALRKGRVRRWDGALVVNGFIPLLDHPPSLESDVPSCVFVYPTPRLPAVCLSTVPVVHGESPIHLPKDVVSEESYPKHYLCSSEMCCSPEGIGSLSTSKICPVCGGECVE